MEEIHKARYGERDEELPCSLWYLTCSPNYNLFEPHTLWRLHYIVMIKSLIIDSELGVGDGSWELQHSNCMIGWGSQPLPMIVEGFFKKLININLGVVERGLLKVKKDIVFQSYLRNWGQRPNIITKEASMAFITYKITGFESYVPRTVDWDQDTHKSKCHII